MPPLARDFHELYLINDDPPLLDANFSNLGDPGFRRKDQQAIQQVRERIHELNFATISLYRMAVYLGNAQRVAEELQLGELYVPGRKQRQLIQLLLNVRKALNGLEGTGIIDDLQDLIGKSVWNEEETSVISYYEFRERLLSDKGWEQFTDLFRFFVHFHFKMDSEVKNTGDALNSLCGTLSGLERPFGAWRR